MHRSRALRFALATIALLVAACGDSPSQPVSTRYAATLGPAPGVTTSASGTASIVVNNQGGRSYSITTTGIDDGVSSRIVDATNGETLVPLWLNPGGDAAGATTFTDQTVLTRLAAGQAYLLVTTQSHPDGELRGTFVPD